MSCKYIYSTILIFILTVLVTCPAIGEKNVKLHGRVIDITTAPVKNAEVYVFDSTQVKRPADYISKPTDTKGRFTVLMPRGKYWAVAVYRKGGGKFGPLMPGDKHSGDPIVLDFSRQDIIEADITIMGLREAARQQQKRSDELIRVSGRIVNERGDPVAMAYAIADMKNKVTGIPSYLSAWTEKDGTYVLYLPAGEYYVGVGRLMPPELNKILSTLHQFREDMEGVEIIFKEE